MKKSMFTILAGGMLLAALVAGPAQAQDEATITVEPASVEAPGTYDFVITGSGFTAAPPILILPCPTPESGDPLDLDGTTCDATQIMSATPVDGAFEVTATFEVTEAGLAIAAADTAQTQAAAAIVTVAAAQGGGADGGTADDAAADDAGDTPADGEVEPTDEALPNTGVESGLIAIIGVAVLCGGAMLIRSNRRLGQN